MKKGGKIVETPYDKGIIKNSDLTMSSKRIRETSKHNKFLKLCAQ